MHEQFAATVVRADLPLLKDVADLAALWVLEQDRAWFLEHGFFTADTAKDLQKEVNKLCHELRPHAQTLVEGFGIPDALLRAPIAVAEQTSGAGTD